MGLIKQGILYSYSHEETEDLTWELLQEEFSSYSDISWTDGTVTVDRRRLYNWELVGE